MKKPSLIFMCTIIFFTQKFLCMENNLSLDHKNIKLPKYLSPEQVIKAFYKEKKFEGFKICSDWPLDMQIQIISNHLSTFCFNNDQKTKRINNIIDFFIFREKKNKN